MFGEWHHFVCANEMVLRLLNGTLNDMAFGIEAFACPFVTLIHGLLSLLLGLENPCENLGYCLGLYNQINFL